MEVDKNGTVKLASGREIVCSHYLGISITDGEYYGDGAVGYDGKLGSRIDGAWVGTSTPLTSAERAEIALFAIGRWAAWGAK